MLLQWPAYSWTYRKRRQFGTWLSCLTLALAGAQSHAASALIFASVIDVASVMDMASINAVSVSTRVPGVIVIRFPAFAALLPAPGNSSLRGGSGLGPAQAETLIDALQEESGSGRSDARRRASLDGLLRGDTAVSLVVSSDQASGDTAAEGLSLVRNILPQQAEAAQSRRLTVVFN